MIIKACSTNFILVEEVGVFWEAEILVHVLLGLVERIVLVLNWVISGLLEELLEDVEKFHSFLLLELVFFVF